MNKEILNRFFQGECTDKEVHEVLLWINSQEAREEMDQLFDAEEEDLEMDGVQVPSAAILESTKRAIHKEQLAHSIEDGIKSINVSTGKRTAFKMLRVAATVAMLMVASWVTYLITDQNQDQPKEIAQQWITKVADPGMKLTVKLPDGSKVKLNSGSKLIYPESFKSESRTVTLIGEAFFDVKRDVKRPFMINSGEIDVKVLGTSFKVKSYPGEEKVQVAVKSGKVAVTGKRNTEKLLLVKNELATYEMSKNTFKKEVFEDDLFMFGWMEQNIVFDDNDVQEIFKILSRWYDVEVEARDGAVDRAKKFTATYKNPTLKVVLESLSIAYDFEYEINGRKVTIN